MTETALNDAAASVAERFAALDGRFLLPALLLQLANLGLRSLAWRNVLAAAYPRQRISYLTIAGAYASGVALNVFMPARAGELAKAVLARTRIRGSALPTVVASLSVVLVFDALFGGALVALLWASGAAPALPAPPSPSATAAVAAAVAILAALAMVRGRERMHRFFARASAGFRILRTPGRYVRSVVPFQSAAWACRLGVVMLVLASFGIQPSVGTAALVLVAGGVSTAVPVPGGGGAQQVLVAYALHSTTSIGTALSFSVAMQFGVALVNTLVGITALMLMFRTLAPVGVIRSGIAYVRTVRP